MKITIIGASGHGKVVADIAEKNGYSDIEFLDDNEELMWCGKYPVVGNTCETTEIANDIIVAVGEASVRRRLTEKMLQEGHSIPILIHPAAVIADDVAICAGTVVMAGAVINPGVRLGKGVIVNTCSSIDHDCKIGDYVHVSVGSHICGNVNVGNNTWIGAGSTVSNNVNIYRDCMIGAGAVVIKDIDRSGTYVGVPARILNMPLENIQS